MAPLPAIVSDVLTRALAQSSKTPDDERTNPQGRVRTGELAPRRSPARGVLDCAACSVETATQFRPIE
jgi:hypothetical protein